MLGTVIVDAYRKNEIREMAEALDDIASPEDAWGWSSSGIYCFWDLDTREIFYVGLAIDIPLRFRHHNNLIACPKQCCKWEWIEEYFNQREKIGYSVILQSTLSQGICSRWERQNPGVMERIVEEFGYMGTSDAIRAMNCYVDSSIRDLEGALIELHARTHGELPRWNKIGGRINSSGADRLAQMLTPTITAQNPESDIFLARRTLRQLAGNATETCFEVFLHSSRMFAAAGLPVDFASRSIDDTAKYADRIKSAEYLKNFPRF